MIKIFMTGDNHFGRKNSRYSIVADKIDELRFKSFENMVDKANEEKANFFVITGDMFDGQSNIGIKLIEKVINILKKFNNKVLILPGNHDYYTNDSKLWIEFIKKSEGADNIVVMNEYKPYEEYSIDEKICFYPAYCSSKHSDINVFDKFEGMELDENAINICVAHGAIEGLSLDSEGVYYPMDESDFKELGMDIYLVGHAHVPTPNNLTETFETATQNYFNAGTHSQLDLANNTDGECFIFEIEKKKDIDVKVKKYVSGILKFKNIDVNIKNSSDLKSEVEKEIKNIKDKNNVIIRLRIKGALDEDNTNNREKLIEEVTKDFLYCEKDFSDCYEEITLDMIGKEYPNTSNTYKFLEALKDDEKELRMAYDLVKNN